jgi:putative hemolysin
LETSIDDPLPGFLLTILNIQTLPAVFYIANASVILVLLFFSGMVSGSEVAFFSLSSTELVQLSNGTRRERDIFHLLIHPKRLLATILILNNLINISIVTLATFVSWQMMGTQDIEGQVVVVLTVVTTFLIVYFGEVVPKIYANQRRIPFLRFSMPFIRLAYWFFKPLAWLLTSFSGLIERRIKGRGYRLTVDEINQALELTAHDLSNPDEKGLLKGIVNFGQLSVKQVMRSRIDITAFDVDMNFHELMDMINKTGYSRFPVYRETIDRIEGILYNKDLLPHLDKKETFKWQKLLRQPYFVPETKKIDTLLKDFQHKHVHMAIVVDEYGGTAGLITLEDVIEEIVGEIRDEFDEDEIVYNKLNDNTYIFEGKTTLHDFCKIVQQDPVAFEQVKGESESLGGLILELNGKLPRAGEKIIFSPYVFTVVAVDQKRIKRVRVLIK